MLTERQEKLLNFLVREYLSTAEPVGSLDLKKVSDLNVSAATIRNDCQVLTEKGYITQPHTSAGRIPTKKAYKYIADRLEATATFYDVHEVNVVRMSIVRQIENTHKEVEAQIRQMEELMQTLENDNLFEILTTIEIWHKKNQN
jgi:heat-inducible transcriptional repressor